MSTLARAELLADRLQKGEPEIAVRELDVFEALREELYGRGLWFDWNGGPGGFHVRLTGE